MSRFLTLRVFASLVVLNLFESSAHPPIWSLRLNLSDQRMGAATPGISFIVGVNFMAREKLVFWTLSSMLAYGGTKQKIFLDMTKVLKYFPHFFLIPSCHGECFGWLET